ANVSFRRHVLLEVGGLDPQFDGNGYRWEADLGLRIKKAGYDLLFDPAPTVQHLMAPHGGCRTHDTALHTYYFVKNCIRLYRKHSPALGLPFFVFAMVLYVVLKSLYNRNPRILYPFLFRKRLIA